MTQEYVVVEEVRTGGGRGTEDGSPSSWWKRSAVAAAVLVAITVVAWVAWPQSADDSEHDPEPDRVVLPAAASTALIYQEWLNRTELSDCLAARGFPYEAAIVDHARLIPTAIHHLGVEPATLHPDAPVPMVRQPDLYLGRGGSQVEEDLRGESTCSLPQRVVDVDDPAAVERAVLAACGDPTFLATLAEQAWVEEHPGEVTHAVSLLRHDRDAAALVEGHGAWAPALGIVERVIGEQAVWVPVVTAAYEPFAQTVALAEHGGAVAVRVSARDAAFDRDSYMTRSASISCGEVTVSAGVKFPWGSREELLAVMQALVPVCRELAAERPAPVLREGSSAVE